MDRNGIAGRLRGLIGGQERGDLGAVAAKLGVDEVSLRMSIDPLAPYPTLDVLSAIVLVYGVDPTWLITGNYNSATHRSAAETAPERMAEAMGEMMRALHSRGESSVELPKLRLMNDS